MRPYSTTVVDPTSRPPDPRPVWGTPSPGILGQVGGSSDLYLGRISHSPSHTGDTRAPFTWSEHGSSPSTFAPISLSACARQQQQVALTTACGIPTDTACQLSPLSPLPLSGAYRHAMGAASPLHVTPRHARSSFSLHPRCRTNTQQASSKSSWSFSCLGTTNPLTRWHWKGSSTALSPSVRFSVSEATREAACPLTHPFAPTAPRSAAQLRHEGTDGLLLRI